MSSSEDANSNCSISLNAPHSSPNNSNPQSPNRSPGLPELPKLLDENGRDLLSDEVSVEGSTLARKWSNATLRRFDRFWHGPARNLFSQGTQDEGSPVQDSISGRGSISVERSHLTIIDNPEHNVMEADELPRFLKAEDNYRRVFHGPLSRFYKPKILQEKLFGPENYKDWAVAMEEKMRQCSRAWRWEGDIMLALLYGDSSSQWTRLNPKVWMMIYSNVSPHIQPRLAALESLDAHEAWQHLERTCGGRVPLRARSVKGVRDIMSIRYDKCLSLKEYLDRMILCIRAIECNPHGEKERYCGGKRSEGMENEWLWCQFILVNLGPEWESWVSELMEKSKDGGHMADTITNLHRLFQIIEAEEARRIQASRYTKFGES
ncbi:hypothetical protein N7452_004365 [Penicillium brevicompactum]|uniref:Uncharacterized protein n=1 Tax=Penicillium brevicompactum TaxID=5074 RepID=A0A9W9QGI7_PENBR|nr:hypothetical protein N7452_004365 [Penicillium brevicompactum]